MERANRIASTLLGVAFAASCGELAMAQQPSRFIKQPAKSPAAAPQTAPPAATIPQTVSTVTPAVKDVSEAPSPKPVAAESSTIATKETAKAANATFDSLLSFPSLLAISDSPDLEFELLDSLPTVPDLRPSTAAGGELNLTSLVTEAPAALNAELQNTAESAKTIEQQQAVVQRADGLLWTSRKNNVASPNQSISNGEPTIQSKTNSSPKAVDNSSNVSQNESRTAQVARQDVANSEAVNQISTRLEAIESKIQVADAPAKEARTRASLVSARIVNDPRFAKEIIDQSAVTRIESPQGWQAIGERLSGHVSRCERLLRRGAYCSAREEADAASMLLFRHIDLHDNLFRCEPAAQIAMQALREAEDFVVAIRSSSEGAIQRLVDAHETTILKNKNLNGMSPLTAAQHYRHFAEAKLTEAAQGHPWSSELLYTVGRTYQAEADTDSARMDVLRMKALAYYRAARITMPGNAVACNQLGYLLLQMDRNEDAREALVAAVNLKSDAAFLSNLAEASRRLGDTQTLAWASQNVAAIRNQTPPVAPVPPIVEISQEEFIAISPMAIGPKPGTDSNQNAVNVSAGNKTATAPNALQMR